jgi:F0F1-type ATP synthase assembly protein I
VKNQSPSNSRKKPSDSSTPGEETKKSGLPDVAGFARYTQIVYLIIGAVAVAFGAGYLLDRWLQLSVPLFKVLFSFGGVIIALYLVYQQLNRK